MASLATLHVTISANVNRPRPDFADLIDLMDTVIAFECQMAAVERVMREPVPDISGFGEALPDRADHTEEER